MSNKRPPSQAKFTHAAIEGAARKLMEFDMVSGQVTWDDLDELDHRTYREWAEKEIEGLRDEAGQLRRMVASGERETV